MAQLSPDQEQQIIGAQVERRSKMRFPIALGVRFVAPMSLLAATGRTVNLSSSGALIAGQQQTSVGEQIHLFVDWPVMLNGATPLQLVAVGYVVRSDAGVFALSFERYEFRTTKKQLQSASDYEKPQYKAKLQ
jgi:hypothetical protein